MGMVDELLFIKEFREKKAEKHMLRTRLNLQQAHHRQEKADDDLQVFRIYAEQEEIRWYEQLCSRVVKPREILSVQEDVAGLRAKEANLAVTLEQAFADHEIAKQHYATAADQHRMATAAKNKFIEVAQSLQAEEARERERIEELELEEVASQLRPTGFFEENGRV
jgi:type III secretion protein O